MKEIDFTKTDMKDSVERFFESLTELDNFSGAGLTEENGELFITAYTTVGASSEDMLVIPKTFEGFEVETETIGEITLQ